MLDYVAEDGVTRGRAGVHAGYLETSMMLADKPEMVDMAAASPGRSDEDFFLAENLQASQMESFLLGVRRQSPNGVLGDPTGANAEVGERLLDLAAASLAKDLVEKVSDSSEKEGVHVR